MSQAATRRERLRQELVDEIKHAALRQLEAEGPAGVTLRGIAREVGVSPAALYGYFDSLSDLITELITDGYNDLADAVAAAAEARDPDALGERLVAADLAYRRWALENPGRFRLLFLTEIPGYEAPPEGPTVVAALRAYVPFLTAIVEGFRRGLTPEPEPGPPLKVQKFRDLFGLDITSDQLRVAVECWAQLHGFVALELSGHIGERWCDPGELFEIMARERARKHGLL